MQYSLKGQVRLVRHQGVAAPFLPCRWASQELWPAAGGNRMPEEPDSSTQQVTQF